MAPFLFVDAILNGRPINIFNHGDMARDFTYIDDAVESVVRVCEKIATPNANFDASQADPGTSRVPYRIFNVGNNQPTPLLEFIATIEKNLGVEAKKNFLPMQPGDVYATAARTDELGAWIGQQPSTSLQRGTRAFITWYRQYLVAL